MKIGKEIYSGKTAENGRLEIDLGVILPIGDIIVENLEEVQYFFVNQWKTLPLENKPYDFSARYINVKARKDSKVTILLGEGYYGKKVIDYSNKFYRKSGWTGGDGIFTFNIQTGNDTLNQERSKTLFVFGDTLVGNVSENHRREEPVLMPNNTIAYLEGIDILNNEIDFRINTDQDDTVISYFSPENDSVYAGTVPLNMVRYDTPYIGKQYLSGYMPDDVELLFDFHQEVDLDKWRLFNYFDYENNNQELSNRGIKEAKLYYFINNDFELLHTYSFNRRTSLDEFEEMELNLKTSKLKLVVTPLQGVGNHYDPYNTKEVLFGIDKVQFYSAGRILKDVKVDATSILEKQKQPYWYWLQDGVVIGSNLYLFPLIVGPDTTKPEGLMFKIVDVSMIKVPIVDGELDFDNVVQKVTPFCHTTENSQWLMGNAIYTNTVQGGSDNPDGYIYIYGYETIGFERHLKLSRVKEENIMFFDQYEFYADGKWVHDMTKASSILEHISCEMSVSKIEHGVHKGKYIAVYTYDVNTKYVAYSIGDNLWGPFTSPKICYEAPEVEYFGKTAYTYNAKAHPHLSNKDELYVTYNINTYSMEHNKERADIYHPRFIKLISIED